VGLLVDGPLGIAPQQSLAAARCADDADYGGVRPEFQLQPPLGRRALLVAAAVSWLR
jgi:hypothetical protein